MSSKVIVLIGITLVLVPSVASAESVQIDLSFPEPIFHLAGGSTQYEIPGLEFTSTPNAPKLPMKREFVRIPANAGNVDVLLDCVETEPLEQVGNLEISKPIVIKTACSNSACSNSAYSNSAYSNSAYSNSAYSNSKSVAMAGIHSPVFPTDIYSFQVVEGFRDYKLVSISVFPLQHDGNKKELFFHRRISLRVRYDITSEKRKSIEGLSVSSGNATKYLIITDSLLNSSLQPLKEWKTKKGVPAEIYTVQWIYQQYNGTPNYVFHSGTGHGLSSYMQATVDLSNTTTANLTFSTRFNLEYGWDFGYVEASLDGESWIHLQGGYMTDYREPEAYVGTPGVYSYTGNSSWIRDTINLDDYTGGEVYLRFHYVTDTYVGFGGWWLDNISLKTDKGILLSADGTTTDGWTVWGFRTMDVNEYENPPQKLIRDFITKMYADGAEWVLLAGGDDLIPALRVQRLWYVDDENEVPTDYYYSCLDGNWNSDGDSKYGEHEHSELEDEILDWIPDVYIGRLPVSTLEEMADIVNKIISYEKSPPLTSSDWFSRALLAGGVSDELTDESKLMEYIRADLLEPNNFSSYRLYHSSRYPKDASLTHYNFEEYVGYGSSIVTWAGHGLYSETVPCSSCSAFVDLETEPSNEGMLPLVYANSCLTGAFDQGSCLGTHVLKNWGIGYIGSSRSSYYTEEWNLGDGFNQDLNYRFFEQFLNGSHQPGKALAKMKQWYYLNRWPNDKEEGVGDASKKNLLQHNLLGDPEIPVWTSPPENFTIDIESPAGIYPGENSISIDVRSDGIPVENARVCLQNSEVYSYGYTNSSGRVEFQVTLPAGSINLTITKHNFIPWEGNISIILDSDPPEWESSTGIQNVTSGYEHVMVEWDNASDMSLPVHYNLYYDTTEEWLCQYQNINVTGVLETEFDLLDLDPDGLNSSQLLTLKNSGKFTLAYINIGWAENWRSYWNSSWENESWLLDEAGWPGEYYVDYSEGEWQSIIHDYIEEIKAKGFSGMYMDNVEAGYQRYESNLSDIRYENCTRENMIEFVRNISLTHRSESFFIFPQNGLDIALNLTDYIDGVGVEDTYYYNTGNPVESKTTEWKESILDNLTSAGKLVLTLDYTENRTETDFTYNRSLSKGYIPYVSTIDLDRLVINEGHETKPVTEMGIKAEDVTSPYTLRNLTNGRIYYFTIRAEDGAGNEDGNNVTLYGVPFQPSGCELRGDADCDGTVSDFELLAYIDQWILDEVDDLNLLEVINNWANE